jgi:hypothetical protein
LIANKKWGVIFIFGCSLIVIAGSLWMADPDVFWHLKVGEWIIANKAVPETDIYSWSVYGQPWTAHQWLWEALMYFVHSCTGIIGLWFLALVMVFTAGMLVRGGLKAKSVSEERASAAGGIAVLLLIGWLKPWPQAGVYALFAAYLFLSLRDKWELRETVAVGALAVLWGNIHSTAVMFPLLLFGETIWSLIFKKEKRKTLRWRLAAFVVAGAGTLLNPHGINLWRYAVGEGLLSNHYRESIYSWMPYVFGFNILALIFFINIVILFVAVRQGKEKELAFVRAAGFWALALMSRIYSPYAVLSTAGLLGITKIQLGTGSLKRLAALALVAGLAIIPVRGFPSDLEEAARKGGYPADALAFIKEEGLEKIYNDHGWGGYLIWRETPVYIDGRNDVYGNGEMLDAFLNLTKTERPIGEVIADTGAQTVLTGINGTKDLALRDSPLWDETYRDEHAVVYVMAR